VNSYFYTPYGGTTGTETDENIDNWFGWAGYYAEDELAGYYCNARNYSGGRFLTRDPVAGQFTEPMSLHVYLYCNNDPINRRDPSGELWGALDRARDLANSISMYYVSADLLLGMAKGPGDILDISVSINKSRESLFGLGLYKKYSAVYGNEGSLWFIPFIRSVQAFNDCFEDDGRFHNRNDNFKHCYVSCNLAKDFGAAGSIEIGVGWEVLQSIFGAWNPKDSLKDIAADYVGAGFGMLSPFVPCAKACEEVYP